MTVCDQYPGLNAEIVVDHRPLKEYDDDEAEPGAISKYVEAASGKEFAMRFTFTRPFPTKHGVEIRVSVDGEQSRVLSYSPDELYKPEGHHKRGVGFQKDGQWYRQNYRFTALNIGETIDDDMIQPTDALKVEEADGASNVADLRKDLQSKGSINMDFRFITNLCDSKRPHTNTQIAILPAMGNIPEKALKGDARSHQATLGKPRPARERKPRMKYTYVNQQPFATMHFKYRSLAALKALQIVNDEGDEEIMSSENGLEDAMTRGQLREALRAARSQEAEASQRLKQERSAALHVKRERAEAAKEGDDEDEVTIVESRSRKRPRGEREVIVLD